MSTTITYKDNLLTTVDNSIKVLRTAGKYLEGDIVLADITAKSQANENDPIRFFDYDGTLVASYTEVPESLPEAPTHKGLIAQGWNWTLEDIATQFASSGACDVGQMYITDDGKTRIHVTVSDMTKSFWLGLAPFGTLLIDWGDGSESSSMTGTSYTVIKKVQHTYAAAGSYIISVEAESGEFAFYNSSSDYTMLFSKYDSSNYYYNWSYGGCVTAIELGNSAMVGNYAFSKLFNLRSVTIPNTVISIGAYAFNGCFTLKSVIIPNTVTIINTSAFYNCYTLESVIIPEGVTNITTSVFQNCRSLKSVIIPDTVMSIGPYAFNGCCALKSVTVPDTMTSISSNAFENCYVLQSVIIPEGVTSISSNAFQNCYVLQSVIIPEGVTSITDSVFQNCYSLESVIISEGVTSIGMRAFANCQSLKLVTIPDTVTKISIYAFTGCYNMDEYHFLPTTPPTLTNTSIFDYIQSNCKIYVPYSEDHSILEAYKTATNWSKYASYMVEEGE